MNQLANMISDKLTMLENDSAPQAVPDKSALQALLEETLDENEYSEQSWNKYAQTMGLWQHDLLSCRRGSGACRLCMRTHRRS